MKSSVSRFLKLFVLVVLVVAPVVQGCAGDTNSNTNTNTTTTSGGCDQGSGGCDPTSALGCGQSGTSCASAEVPVKVKVDVGLPRVATNANSSPVTTAAADLLTRERGN